MKWIKCSKKMPKIAKIVLVTDGNQVGLGFRGLGKDPKSWTRPVANDVLIGIIAWSLLPKPPRYKI